MSSVSSLSRGADLYSLLHKFGVGANSNVRNTSPTVQDNDGDSDQSGASQSAGAGHGHRGHQVLSTLESAITSALQSASAAGTANDPNQIIQNTIASVLGKGQGSDGADAENDGDADDGGASGSQSAGSAATQQADFNKLLQSYGVSPAQFQQDLKSALQSFGDGNAPVSFSKLFQSFPPGSLVNTTA